MTTTNKPTGGPVFPKLDYSRHDERDGTIDHFGTEGMQLRDWFAGQALQGLLAHPDCCDVGAGPEVCATVAKEAYMMADAMIAERAKP